MFFSYFAWIIISSFCEINNDMFHNDNYEVHFCGIEFVFAGFWLFRAPFISWLPQIFKFAFELV